MKKLTVHEKRNNEIKRLHALKGCKDAREEASKTYWNALETSIDECTKEKHIMTLFYQLCSLEEKALYIDNTKSLYTEKRSKEIEEKANKKRKKVNNLLKDYSLKLVYYGYLPTITNKDGNNEIITSYFYQ